MNREFNNCRGTTWQFSIAGQDWVSATTARCFALRSTVLLILLQGPEPGFSVLAKHRPG